MAAPLSSERAAAVRRDFPVLQRTVRDGKPLVYLDNAATTQKPASVVKAVCEYYGTCNANVHRAFHYLAEQATEHYEGVRRRLAAWIGAPSPESIVFTRGTTESVNLVAAAWGGRNVRKGDRIIVTGMEHHSNLISWQQLAQRNGAELSVVPVLEDGTLDLDVYGTLLQGPVKLAAFSHGSNVLGTVNPAREMARMARDAGAMTLVDAAQTVPHRPVSMEELGCDFLAFSGHKMCGPTGIGVLAARPEILDAMDPYQTGGEMIDSVTYEKTTWAELPRKFEAGTPHVAGAIGLGAALDYLDGLGMTTLQATEEALTRILIERLDSVPGLTVHGRAPERGGAVSFSLEGVHPHDVAQLADREGVAVRAGHLCAQPLMKTLGVPAVTRASLYFYNDERDLDALIRALERIREVFGT
jgi:cysteine desulfurase / selenocysteine lyase